MKIRLQREEILPIFSAVASIADRRPIQAILSHALVETMDSGLRIIATDTEIQLQSQVPAEIQEGGRMALPARKAYDIIRSLPQNSSIQLEKAGEKVTFRSGSARFTLPILAADDFPRMENSEIRFTSRCSGNDFAQGLAIASVAMAHNDARYFLNGVLLEVAEQRLRFIGTDGHRLAFTEIPLAHDEDMPSYQGILPRKAVLELLRVMKNEELQFHLGPQACTFRQDQQEFSCRLIDAKYPDYRRVIPVGHPFRCSVDRETLKSALQQIDVISSDKNPACTLRFEAEELILRSRNEEQAEGEIHIPATLTGTATEIAFNTRYLLDLQNICTEERLQIEIRDANNSALLHGEENPYPLYIVMPIRL